MNKIQEVVSAISGYSPSCDAFAGARDDFYYACETTEDKLAQIIAYGQNGLDEPIYLSMNEALKVMEWLETEFGGSNSRWYAFNALGFE